MKAIASGNQKGLTSNNRNADYIVGKTSNSSTGNVKWKLVEYLTKTNRLPKAFLATNVKI